MAYKRKSWNEKMHNGANFNIQVNGKRFADVPAGATMLIATPEIVADYINNIPEGKESTLAQMRKDLAATYNAEFCCPVTAGIFLRIVSEAAIEDLNAGKRVEDITPFWRIISSKLPTAKKMTFGTEFIKQRRLTEGLPE